MGETISQFIKEINARSMDDEKKEEEEEVKDEIVDFSNIEKDDEVKDNEEHEEVKEDEN